MTRREQLLIAACCLLTVALVIQTVTLKTAEARLQEEIEKPYWPDRPDSLELGATATGKFAPSTGTAVPASFWGEFAEDVHDCGGEKTMLVKKDEILMAGDDRQKIETVRWKRPQEIEIDTRDGLFNGSSFSMILSDDRDEITLVYTNIKRVVQRCAARSHGPAEIPAPVLGTMGEESDEMNAADLNVAEDLNAAGE